MRPRAGRPKVKGRWVGKAAGTQGRGVNGLEQAAGWSERMLVAGVAASGRAGGGREGPTPGETPE